MELAASPRPVLAEHVAQQAAHLSYGGIGPQCLSHRWKQVLGPLSRLAHLSQGSLDSGRVAFRPKPLERLDLLALMVGTDLANLDVLVVPIAPVQPNDDSLPT